MWAPDLFTLNNYVVIRHADTNSHSSTYFLVTNIFIRILNVLIHSHSRSYDFYSTLAFFIQHSLICKIHKFRILSLWTINFFFTNMFIHIRDVYSITFNGKICYSIHSTFCAHLSLRIIWSQAPVSGLDLLETGDPPCWFGEHHKASFSLSKFNFQWWSRNRLRVVPHFSSGIVERAKRKRAWKSALARKGDTRREEGKIVSPRRVSPFLAWVIFTRDRVSLALLSLRKNGGILVV